MPQLLSNVGATGAGSPVQWGGGEGQFEVAATSFGGGTITLQVKQLDGSYGDVANTALTANGRALFKLPPCTIRANVTTAAPTAANAAAWRVRNP